MGWLPHPPSPHPPHPHLTHLTPTPLPHPPTNPPDVPRQLVAPCKLLRTTAPGAGEGTLTCDKVNVNPKENIIDDECVIVEQS